MTRIFLILFFILMTGCQKQAYIKPDLSLSQDNASRLIVYRPKSDWVGLAIDYRVFAGNFDLGSIAAGQYVDTFIPSEKTTITVQGHFLGFADGKPAKEELLLERGKTYYFRFTQKFDGIVTAGNSHIATGSLSLLSVEKKHFEMLK